ncbi:receptor-like protein EIX1 [Juglans microcarpa x Juglans regia]|uniref:receptor-like protein EIX1 n=1 Tax=Juglans microcarpa x Juglans regia TaxID=2249226 RepID=UPI001B7E1B71|nr:receptor-like protein EIX1 [Juglans microcarpa x Juglans regia]
MVYCTSGDEECCFWKGIGSENLTGHVIHLNLQNPYDPTTDYEAFERSRLGGIISNSLLELKYLQYIDLSFSHFEGHQIPSFFGHLGNLRYLNLSQAGFVGDIPFQFANLTKLHYLDIRGLLLDISNLEWLSHLSLLEFLDMSVNNLNKASNWLQMLNMLSSLSELHLSACQLDEKYDPIPYVNFTSLTLLDLSLNHFVSSTFGWLHNLTSLVTLDLGYNRIQVPIHIPITLKSLYLGGNNFLDKIPNWLFNITTLETLDLSGNHIQGVLPNAFGCLSQLKHLDLSFNGLEGKLPSSLGTLCNLQHLDLSHNKLGRGLYEVLGNSSASHKKFGVLAYGG